MVRNYHRKKEKVPREILLSALRQLKLQHDLKWGQSSYRTVAHSHGISKTTLFNHFQKVKHLASIPDNYFLNQAHHRQILKSEEEEELVGYLKLAMESNHSLTPTEVRKLVYSFVLGNGIKCPAMWHEYHSAGEDWFTSFMKRNQCLSLRKAEATSQARAAGFNYPVVHSYQDTLGGVFARHQYPQDRIINIDETSNQTVMAPETVVAIRGTKQVRQTTGAERGNNVSMICFGIAAGGFIPPAYVFPLKNVNRKSMNNSIPGSIAFANGTGWFDGNIMVDVIEHVQKYVQSAKKIQS
ncbi:hypothetical protein DAPPUDRAFT_330428 [Daphnia pulex]|uniref:HTH CENPB-type domain-containing protein n=1 Tax=Daphnia pulex TaxID=6669 RepID=E9HJJ3_DAPPU|nr:hypothetical protein DAPPUDRAFT_330428 [Daphnia pulex]|eukprot:EFX68101.1 hypothetical protein DAPPUDRAFT_330428 [Daphnia pulex]